MCDELGPMPILNKSNVLMTAWAARLGCRRGGGVCTGATKLESDLVWKATLGRVIAAGSRLGTQWAPRLAPALSIRSGATMLRGGEYEVRPGGDQTL